MGYCPSSCGDIELLANPQQSCTTDIRQKTLSRIGFFPCNTTLPDPITSGNIAPLFADGTIVVSSELANIVLADPTTEDIVISECSPAKTIITTRELTAEDRIAIEFQVGSPSGANPYFDYSFWADKQEKQFQMSYMLFYCDGDVVIPRDANGVPLRATLLAYLAHQKPGTQGGAWVEFKRISLKFQGDPLALTNTPEFNWIEAGITL